MSGLEVVVVVVVIVVWLGLVALALRGWRNRGRRQAEAIGTPPPVPADLPAPLRGPDTGLYVGSTLAPSWQDRVAVGDFGDRAAASISAYPQGILVDRQGASEIWIPRESITAVRTERGLAGKVMTADGVLVIRWLLPSGTAVDSGVRADDKTIYPGWVSEFADAAGAPDQTGSDQAEQGNDQ
ncbi:MULTISPECIES: PH-like domain-containing protein [Gordonia]|uniref:Transporter n=1 Tax=Gordonia tangerina TaxID=2911060 RepID=A0ABS9DEE3_9ACTN|nr:transporter [Gordonia tangerina]MCF3937457.1 transporter [Gordonia tangerina]